MWKNSQIIIKGYNQDTDQQDRQIYRVFSIEDKEQLAMIQYGGMGYQLSLMREVTMSGNNLLDIAKFMLEL